MSFSPGGLRWWFFSFAIMGIFPFKWIRNDLTRSLSGSLVAIGLAIYLNVPHCVTYSAASHTVVSLLPFILHFYVAVLAIGNATVFILKSVVLKNSLKSLLTTYESMKLKPFRIPMSQTIPLLVTTIMSLSVGILISFTSNSILVKSYFVGRSFVFIYENGLLLLFASLVRIPSECLTVLIDEINGDTGSFRRDILFTRFIGLYGKLVDDCRNLNKSFEIQLLSTMGLLVFQTIFNLFDLLSPETLQLTHSLTAINFISYVLLSTIGMNGLFIECERCMQKATTFTNLLSNLALQNYEGHLDKNPHITMHFIIKKKLKFTTYGGITLNYRFMLSLIASCITYLMILLQFNNPSTCPTLPDKAGPTLEPATT